MSNKPSFKDVFLKGAVIFNPVLVQLVGLCPVVAASTTLQGAFTLSIIACVELIAICVLASALMKDIPRWIRVPLYFIFGLVLVCPVLWYLETQTLMNLSLGMKIYIPLIAINSVVAVHCEQFAVKNSVRLAFYDAAAVGLGASGVFLIAGAIREILGSSSIGGIALDLPVTFRGMLLPFGCLVILGYISAALRAFVLKKYPEFAGVSEMEKEEKIKEEPQKQPETVNETVAEETVATEPVAVDIGFEIPEFVPEEKPSEEDVKIRTEAEIDEFFKSLGIDLGEKGDEQ